MSVAVIKTTWTGGPSAPGLTTFALEYDGAGNLDGALTAVQTFWTSLKDSIQGGYQLQVQPVVELHNETTGELSGEFAAASAKPTLQTQNTSAFAAGVGARIDWRTLVIKNGRRVRGRTFVLPLATASYEVNGTIAEVTRTGIGTAATKLITDLDAAGTSLAVWSRPSEKHPVGALSPVSVAVVPDKVAFLSGRRG